MLQASLSTPEGQAFLAAALAGNLVRKSQRKNSGQTSKRMASDAEEKSEKKKSKAARKENEEQPLVIQPSEVNDTGNAEEKSKKKKKSKKARKEKDEQPLVIQPSEVNDAGDAEEMPKKKKKKSKKARKVRDQEWPLVIQSSEADEAGPSKKKRKKSKKDKEENQEWTLVEKKGKKGKSIIPPNQTSRFKKHQKLDDRRNLKEGKRQSRKLMYQEQSKNRYRALHDESDTPSSSASSDHTDSEGEAWLKKHVYRDKQSAPSQANTMQRDYQTAFGFDSSLEDGTPVSGIEESGGDTDEDDDRDKDNDRDKDEDRDEDDNGNTEDDKDYDDDYDDTLVEDYDDKDDEEANDEQQAVGEKGKKRKPKVFLEPNSDNDQALPKDGEEYPQDGDGWTRQFTNVTTKRFRGPQPPGPTFETEGFREVDFFLQFFPLQLFALIVGWTNQCLRKAKSPETNVAEIRAWFGMIMVMGLSKTTNFADYWSTKPGFRNELISTTMSRNRFQKLAANLACADPATDTSSWPNNTEEEKQHVFHANRNNPLFPLTPIWNAVLHNCRTKYNALRELAIDEAMVAYKGFKSIVRKFFMPTKPIRAGFKIYALCESGTGFMLNFDIHRIDPSRKGGMKQIAYNIIQPFFDKFHHVFCDKLYTAVQLGHWLLAKRTYLTGAIKMNARDLPTSLSPNTLKNPTMAKSIQQMKKTQRGTLYARQNNQLTYVLWRDSSIMSLLSTAHNAFRENSDQLVRSFSIDGRKRRADHTINAPRQAIDYNMHMGGVDRADQLRSYHTCTRKSMIWWKPLLYFLIDISRVNGWICFKLDYIKKNNADPIPADIDDHQPAEDQATPHYNGPSHSHFVMAVAEQLIDGYCQGNNMLRKFGPRQLTTRPPVPARNGPNHQHVRMGSVSGRQCVECQRMGRHRNTKTASGKWRLITSRWGCSACGVYLCYKGKDGEHNCFQR